jgi:hypothetical protein
LLLSPRAGKVPCVGFLDKARALFGIDKAAPKTSESGPAPAGPHHTRKKDGRPPLPEITASAGGTVEDALAARDKGAKDEAYAILAAIDKGQGLRTVLRAAAALEAGDEVELAKLLSAVAAEQPAWQLRLQVAAALEEGERRAALVREGVRLGAPAWSVAWLDVDAADETRSRAALVDLLFEDAALARTVAARELGAVGVKPDNDAIRRYTSFAHGRDLIKRFGAKHVSNLLERVGAKPS